MTGVVLAAFLVAASPQSPTGLTAAAPDNDSGRKIELRWSADRPEGFTIERSADQGGPWTSTGSVDAGDTSFTDAVPPGSTWWYRVRPVAAGAAGLTIGPVSPEAALFHSGRWNLFLTLLLLSLITAWLLRQARLRPDSFYIRPMPGVDAIEEAIGRCTEMGRPVIYVPGIEELQNIQTIAALQILGPVAEKVAEYASEIIVACRIPLVREIAEEVVKQGFYRAGRPDAHKPEDVRFISPEQFDFCAGTNGIILREKPAANLYLGRFFAESLILAETGFVNGAIQIGGTAEVAQLPFFIAACDYTLIGEELFAVSAYMSRDPALLATIKASDWAKILILIFLAVGVVASTLGYPEVAALLKAGTE